MIDSLLFALSNTPMESNMVRLLANKRQPYRDIELWVYAAERCLHSQDRPAVSLKHAQACARKAIELIDSDTSSSADYSETRDKLIDRLFLEGDE